MGSLPSILKRAYPATRSPALAASSAGFPVQSTRRRDCPMGPACVPPARALAAVAAAALARLVDPVLATTVLGGALVERLATRRAAR